MKVLKLFPLALLLGCAHDYKKTVNHVDVQKFMGSWFVQAGRFTPAERDPYNSVETYTWNEKKEQIDIDFRYNKGSFDGPVKKVPQTGWIDDKQTNATWKVSPFWPLKFGYLIIALDPDYKWTAVGVPGQSYLWIMSRDPQFPKSEVEKILAQLGKDGYRVDEIEYVEHKKN